MRRSGVIALMLFAAACGGGPDVLSSESAAQSPPTFLQNLAPDPFENALADRLADDGSIPLATAVDLFASTFGSFPGGDPTAFPNSDPHAATLALMAVAAHYDELTAEQIASLHAAVESPGPQASAAGSTGIEVGYRRSAQPSGEDYVAAVEQARDEIAARLGHPLGIEIRVETRSGTEAVAWASPMRGGSFVEDGRPDECLVEVWPERMPPGDFTRSVLTHEVFHCFQYVAHADLSATFDTAPWITEGQAFWVAAEIVGIDQDWITVGYHDWLCRPEISLWKRLRPAMGIYATVATHGSEDVWHRLEDMLGRSREAAVAALGVDPADALRLVATARMNDPERGSTWFLEGAGIPNEGCIETGTATPDAPWEWTGELQAFSASPPFVVSIDGDVARVDGHSSVGAIEFADGTDLTWSGTLVAVVCLLDGGCECPDGRTIGDIISAPGPAALVAGSGAGAVSVRVAPLSLEDACLERADLPRMSLQGNPTAELEGGVCVIDAGDLILSIGYEPEYDARPQPEPLPHLLVRVFIRGRPGTSDTGSIYVLPDATAIRVGDGGMVMTLSEDLLTGTFTWSNGSGSFSCPYLLTPAEAAAGPS